MWIAWRGPAAETEAGGGGALTPALGSLFSAGSCMTLEASSDGATSEISKPEKDMEPDAEVCSEIPGGQG